MPRLLPATIAAAVLSLALPATGAATTTATRVGSAITITGDGGPNVISVDGIGNFITYKDPTGPNIVAGEGCFQESDSLINCGQGGPGLKATVVLGAGDDTYDDRVARTDWPVVDVDAGEGNDTVNGSYGSDTLRGGPGNDILRGIAGDDQIDGGAGDDTIHGGADNDTIVGGAGHDLINGDGDYSGTTIGGNDVIKARDGEVDQITCGWGADIAEVDADDAEDVDCETVDQSTGGPSDVPGGLTVTLGRPKPVGLRALANGTALVVPATISEACVGVLKLTVGAAEARRAKLGRSKVTLASLAGEAPAGRVRLSLKVKAAYRSKVRRLKQLKTTLSIACATPSGSNAGQAMSLTLTR
ncbi:MAG: calcium-binding protein [Solirubrobacteraceae bacterium]